MTSADHQMQTWFRERNQWWVRPPMWHFNKLQIRVVYGQPNYGMKIIIPPTTWGADTSNVLAQQIQYVSDSDFSVPTAPDPTATSFPWGLGTGQLYRNGVDTGAVVLVRHNFQPQTDPIMAWVNGDHPLYEVTGPYTLTADDATTYAVYRVGFPSI